MWNASATFGISGKFGGPTTPALRTGVAVSPTAVNPTAGHQPEAATNERAAQGAGIVRARWPQAGDARRTLLIGIYDKALYTPMAN